MAQTTNSTAMPAAAANNIVASNFRLGENHMSDGSDTDQSVRSERSISPSKNTAALSKNKKKKVRKQVGALTDELDTLLGAAFQAPTGTDDAASVIKPQVDTEQTMQVDAVSTSKKMSKRTRQNMLKMEARKRSREAKDVQMENVATTNVMQTVGANSNGGQRSQSKKNTKQARRLKKEKQRAKKAAQVVDAMEIG